MENNNSVCFIGKIKSLEPIEGADLIELAKIEGWNSIVQKGQFSVNDYVIVATTDAMIPSDLAESLNITNYLRSKSRVRTVKLKGVYSECLLMSKDLVPVTYHTEGLDLMDKLGIYKYEPPVREVQLSSGRKYKYKDNPNFKVYFKFPNLKNVPNMFNPGDEVHISRKLHGTNARYGIVKKTKLSFWDKVRKFLRLADKFIDYEFVYGSHNVEKGSDSQGFYSTDVWKTIADKFEIKKNLWNMAKSIPLEELGSGLIIYGEIYGPGIQKNFDYGLKEIDFAGIDSTINGEYIDVFECESLFYNLGLSVAPALFIGNWSQEIQNSYIINNFISGTKIPHEGIVIKAISGSRTKIAKVINPDYTIYAEKKDVGDSH
jgi:RNA ligase (TIGR02306 family)